MAQFSSIAHAALRVGLLAGFSLAACSSPPAPPTDGQPQGGSSAIQWDRSPTAVIFRSEVTNGDTTSIRVRDDMPECSIYGDNRVVWLNYLGPFEYEVLYDIVSDDRIEAFVSYLANAGIYNYEALADLQVPSLTPPIVERLLLAVNGIEHRADGFSGWAPTWFRQVVDACKAVSAAPVLFVPEGAWLSAEQLSNPNNGVLIVWDAAASGLDFAAIATAQTPVWITGANLRILWNFAVNQPESLAYAQEGVDGFQQQYAIALQIPSFSRVSPAAPSS